MGKFARHMAKHMETVAKQGDAGRRQDSSDFLRNAIPGSLDVDGHEGGAVGAQPLSEADEGTFEAEERIRAGARRAAETDMTDAEYAKYARLRGGDLLAPEQAASGDVARRYHRPERFQGAMESGEGSSLVGLGELNAHVRNRTRMFKPEDGGPSLFDKSLTSAKKARERLARPEVEGNDLDAQYDEESRRQFQSLDWIGNSNAGHGAAGPFFRPAGSADRPYFTELIPQQYTYSRARKDDATLPDGPSLPIGPMRELQAQETEHEHLTRQRDMESQRLESGYEAERPALQAQVTQAQAASDEAKKRKLGTYNPFKAIWRAWNRMKDRKRTKRELQKATDALSSRDAKYDTDWAGVHERRGAEDSDIAQKGQPLLDRRQALIGPGIHQQPDPGARMNLADEIPQTAVSRDDSEAPEIRRNVVDPFADKVFDTYSREKELRKKFATTWRKQGNGEMDNYAQALLKLPEPDRDPRNLGIREAQQRGGNSYQDAIQAHAQRRLLGDIANEDQIGDLNYEHAKGALIGVGDQRRFLESELEERAKSRPEPRTDEERASAQRFEGFQQQLSDKMAAYLDVHVARFRPKAEKRRAERDERKRTREETRLQLEQWKTLRPGDGEGPTSSNSVPEDEGSSDVQLRIPEFGARDTAPESGAHEKRTQKTGGPVLDQVDPDVQKAAEFQEQLHRPRTVMPEMIGDYMPSPEELQSAEDRAKRQEGEAAVQLAPMEGALNEFQEKATKFQFDQRREYLARGLAPGEAFDESEMDVLRPGPNPDNFQQKYVKGDHFATDRMRESPTELDPYNAYESNRALYKSFKKDKKKKREWEEATGKTIERYKIDKKDPLFGRIVSGKKSSNVKHGYRVVDR